MQDHSGIPNSVDEYLDALPNNVRATLASLRQTIKSAAPQCDEVISYRMPAYKYHGPVVFFAAFKDHCSLFAVKQHLITKFEKELKGFHISGTTIHFTADRPLPESLVKKIVKIRVKENAEKYLLGKEAKNKTSTRKPK